MGRTVQTVFEREGVIEINFTSQNFQSEQMVISQPPGTFEIVNCTFVNGTATIQLDNPELLRGNDVHPGMDLFEDEGSDGVGPTVGYTILSVDPTHATEHITLTTNWVGTGAKFSCYVKRPEETFRYVLLAWESFVDVAQTLTFEEKAADGATGADVELFQAFLAANGGVSSFYPRKLTFGKTLAVTSSAGTDTSLNIKLLVEKT